MNFEKIYRDVLNEGRIPSIFRKATPEEVAERKVQYQKIKVDEWVERFKKRLDVRLVDGKWDASDLVRIHNISIASIPLQFGKIDDDFIIGYQKKLTSLQGSPNFVRGSFDCSATAIESLDGSPDHVGDVFDCSNCQKLTSLVGGPTTVRNFDCCFCNGITTLHGVPREVYGFACMNCNKLTSLEGSPEIVNHFFKCSFCENLTSLKGAPKVIHGNFHCEDGKFTESEIREHVDVRGKIFSGRSGFQMSLRPFHNRIDVFSTR